MRAVWAQARCMATSVENCLHFVNVNSKKTRAEKHFHKGRPEKHRGNLGVIFSFSPHHTRILTHMDWGHFTKMVT